jgi:hypothetical protein
VNQNLDPKETGDDSSAEDDTTPWGVDQTKYCRKD